MKEVSAFEVEGFIKWLRSHPEIGDFDEAEVAERYRSLRVKHEQDVAKGKPGWMRTPGNIIRDDLIRQTQERQKLASDIASAL